MFGLPEALMSFIRRQVGLRTDAASATGSLHAKVKDIKDTYTADYLKGGTIFTYASNTLQASADTEQNVEVGQAYILAKSIQIGTTGVIRVSFDLKSAVAAYNADGTIYRNGVAYGTERNANSTYITFTEDLFFTKGDYIQ